MIRTALILLTSTDFHRHSPDPKQRQRMYVPLPGPAPYSVPAIYSNNNNNNSSSSPQLMGPPPIRLQTGLYPPQPSMSGQSIRPSISPVPILSMLPPSTVPADLP